VLAGAAWRLIRRGRAGEGGRGEGALVRVCWTRWRPLLRTVCTCQQLFESFDWCLRVTSVASGCVRFSTRGFCKAAAARSGSRHVCLICSSLPRETLAIATTVHHSIHNAHAKRSCVAITQLTNPDSTPAVKRLNAKRVTQEQRIAGHRQVRHAAGSRSTASPP
jgi:hypothetical protein